MKSVTLFIDMPNSWDAVSASLRRLSRHPATTVRFAGTIEEFDEDANAIDVLISSVGGMADYALEIYGKELLNLPNDTIGMHLACSTNASVLVPDESETIQSWVLLRPDGSIFHVVLDARRLGESRIEYYLAEPSDEPKRKRRLGS